MSLSPEQSDDLRRLLTDELCIAWQIAIEQGASAAALTGIVDERRAIAASVPVSDDVDGQGGDLVNDARVAD